MRRTALLLLCACGPTLPSGTTSSSSGQDVPPAVPPIVASSGGTSTSTGAASSTGSSSTSSSTSSTTADALDSTGCSQPGTAYRSCDPACDQCSDGLVCRGEESRAACTNLCETADQCPPTDFPPPWDAPICAGTCAIPCAPDCPNPSVYACVSGRCLPLF